jgi:hypothetical protein
VCGFSYLKRGEEIKVSSSRGRLVMDRRLTTVTVMVYVLANVKIKQDFNYKIEQLTKYLSVLLPPYVAASAAVHTSEYHAF